jgi:hypothetical protein
MSWKIYTREWYDFAPANAVILGQSNVPMVFVLNYNYPFAIPVIFPARTGKQGVEAEKEY